MVQDALIPITVPYCVNCMAPLDELLPSELKRKSSLITTGNDPSI